jgi:hypothetical protein
MDKHLRKEIKKVARQEFKIPKSKYINLFKIARDMYMVTYQNKEVEHKHVLTFAG